VALANCEFAQSLVECDEARMSSLREGQEPAVADPLRCGLGRKWRRKKSEALLHLLRIRTKLDARICQPLVVDSPSVAKGEQLMAHHYIVRE